MSSFSIGDAIYARKQGRARGLTGTLVQVSDGDWTVQTDGGKTVVLDVQQWNMQHAHEDEHRFTPVRVTPVSKSKVAEHLFRYHGWDAERVSQTSDSQLLQEHTSDHQVAREHGFTLNHVHGMTPQEADQLSKGLR